MERRTLKTRPNNMLPVAMLVSRMLLTASVASLLASVPVMSEEAEVVFYGRPYSRTFSEEKVHTEANIAIKLDDVLLTSSAAQNGWYVTDSSNDELLMNVLTNDNVNSSSPADFVITVLYSTRGQSIVTYRVVDLSITEPMNVGRSPGGLFDYQSFALKCVYNASGLAKGSEVLDNLYWTQEGGSELSSFSNKQNKLHITKTSTSTTLMVEHKGSHTKYNVPQPLSSYSGVYGCHFILSGAGASSQTLRGVLSTEVCSPPTVIILSSDHQVSSSDTVSLTCNIYGYPRPDVTWLFSSRSIGEKQTSNNNYSEIINGYHRKTIKTQLTVGHGGIAVMKSVLTITDTDHKADRGVYKCLAVSANSSSEQTVYLRIRNRLAFVIPLSGIAGEIVIVAACILLSMCLPQLSSNTHTTDRICENAPPVTAIVRSAPAVQVSTDLGSAHGLHTNNMFANVLRRGSQSLTLPLSNMEPDDQQRHDATAASDIKYYPHELAQAVIIEDPLSEEGTTVATTPPVSNGGQAEAAD